MSTLVNWGVLGTARIAEQQIIPAVRRSTNGRVLGVSSASGRAGAFARNLGISRAYTSHAALLADPEIDAVYIPLPNALHTPWTIRSAAAGKHVLCENPIALNPDQLTEVEARFHFLMDTLRDVGCYAIDLMNLLLDGPPTEVAAVAVRPDSVGVEITLAAVLRFDNGVIGTFSCGFESPTMDHCMILGTNGSIELQNPFRPDANGGVIVVRAGSYSERIELDGDAYRSEDEDFARRIMASAPDTEGVRLSCRTVETTDRVAQAARQS